MASGQTDASTGPRSPGPAGDFDSETVRQPLAMGERDGLGPAADAELPENPLDVRGDGLRADHQHVRDLVLREAVGEVAENLPLARRQTARAITSVPVFPHPIF